MRREKGITLVALVMTIVVMLILVGVTVSTLINSDLIAKAKDVGEQTKNHYDQEGTLELADLGFTGSNLVGLDAGDATLASGVTAKTDISTIVNENLRDPEKIKVVLTDSNNKEVPIPIGANYVMGTESTGVVISYKGSQFVWVPVPMAEYYDIEPLASQVPTSSTNSTYNGYTYTPMAIKINGNYYTISYTFSSSAGAYLSYPNYSNLGAANNSPTREPAVYDEEMSSYMSQMRTYITGYSGKTDEQIQTDWPNKLNVEYNAMIESVKKYGGFYVGRYECSLNGNTVASVLGASPLTTTSGGTWYGMYQKCRDFSGSSSEDTMQSNMIWISQWDAMLIWIQTGTAKNRVTSTSYGLHDASAPYGTGRYNDDGIYDVMNRIYDLEGNMCEYNMGIVNGGRTGRGGSFDDGDGDEEPAYAKYRISSPGNWTSTRLTLYIK